MSSSLPIYSRGIVHISLSRASNNLLRALMAASPSIS